MTDHTHEGARESEMSENDDQRDELIDGVARVLRAREPTAPDFTSRLMAVLNPGAEYEMASRARVPGARSWWRRTRTLQLSVSPLGALAAATFVAAVALLGTRLTQYTAAQSDSPATIAAATPPSPLTGARRDTVHVVRFVFLAPHASSVVMVGDFNNWDRGVTPLRRVGLAGAWSVSVSLPPGLHQYAFIVDGTEWTPDPATSTTVSDEFKTTTSLIDVGGAS
jgi:Glycogen recognition site of AMP-activated protein kinase